MIELINDILLILAGGCIGYMYRMYQERMEAGDEVPALTETE